MTTATQTTQPQTADLYEIIDGKTGARVGTTYTNRTRASRRVDRLDNEYGAYRYSVRLVR